MSWQYFNPVAWGEGVAVGEAGIKRLGPHGGSLLQILTE